MLTRRFAAIAGIVYLLVGIAGFFPGWMTPPQETRPLSVHALHGQLFGLFPVNLAHTLVHLAVGAWGLLAARSAEASIGYARALAIIFAVLAVMGLFPTLDVMFGLMPLHGHDIWLHAGTAAVAAYVGWYAAQDLRS